MTKRTLIVEGLDEVLQSFANAQSTVRKEGERFMDKLGVWTVGRAKAYTLDAGAVDTGELAQGIHHTTEISTDTITTTVKPSEKADKYALYVEEGTAPHFAPIDALRPWANRHNIPVGAVWWSIATKGTKPRYIFRDTFNDVKDRIDNDLNSFADTILRQL